MLKKRTVLLRITGPDQPGITAGIMDILHRYESDILDVEQFVVRNRLTEYLLIDLGDSAGALKELLFFGWERDLDIDFEVVDTPAAVRPRERFAVTVLGERISASSLAKIANAISAADGNIDRIRRMSSYPVLSYEFAVEADHGESLRTALIAVAGADEIDVAVQSERLERRAKRLVVLDVDSTIIRNEAIELLAEMAGVGDTVAEITTRAMQGELEFEESLRTRVALLAGLPEEALDEALNRITLTPGARTFTRTLARMGYRIGIVSGGFTFVTAWLAKQLGLDHAFGNTLEIEDGKLTGRIIGPIVSPEMKRTLLEEMALAENVSLDQTVAVGDGANDVEMLSAAGLGIAFNAKPIVKESADTTLSVPYLDAILFILGVRREDVERADELDTIAEAQRARELSEI